MVRQPAYSMDTLSYPANFLILLLGYNQRYPSAATIASTSMFIMSILFIIMMFAAPAINPHAGCYSINLNWKSLMPAFNLKYLT